MAAAVGAAVLWAWAPWRPKATGSAEIGPPSPAASPPQAEARGAEGIRNAFGGPAAVGRWATLAGRVVDPQGRPVRSASVSARGPASRAVESGPGGAFELEGLPAGGYLLYARQGEWASAPLGPIPLAPGEEVRELVVILEIGAALSGAVVDARDGSPVAGASVSAGAAVARCDERGRYRLAGLPGGTLAVTAAADGFVPRSAHVELTLGRERQGADIHLERGARVRGFIRAGAEGVAGAQIFWARYGFAARLSQVEGFATSGPGGAFEGTVPAGRLEIVGRAAGYAEARSDEMEVLAGEERRQDLSLGSGGAVFGQVRDATGAGVPGCRMSGFDSVHGRETGSGTSGPVGQYWIAGLPQAVYVVVATCAAGRAEVSGIKVSEGEQVSVDLALGTGVIGGRVVDGAGAAVAGAAILVRQDGSAAPGEALSRSGADGDFEVRGLSPSSRFALKAVAQGGTSPEVGGLAPGMRDVALVVGSGVLAGRVVGDRREPVSDFTVYAEPSELGGGRSRSQRFLSPNGGFRMALAPGVYAVRVGAPGYAPAGVPAVEVRAQGSRPLTIALARGATLRGRALDPKGAPVPFARVATVPNLLWAFGRAAPVPSGAAASADASGAFVLSGVPAGPAKLFAYKEGYSQRGPTTVEVASGDEVSADVVLEPNPKSEPDPGFAGVGMTLRSREGAILIEDVFEGGPAREAGLRPGDLLMQVDNVPTAGTPLGEVVGRIRGEVGTPVSLVVRRGGRDFLLNIARAAVRF
jgi:hypothetical protein